MGDGERRVCGCLRAKATEGIPVSGQGLDAIQSAVGEFGIWQAFITALLSLLKIPVAWFLLGIVFFAPPPTSPPTCSRPEGANVSLDRWRNISHPYVVVKGNVIVYDNCQIYDLNYTEIAAKGWNISVVHNESLPLMPCRLWEYDRSVFAETIITEWDLVCDRSQLANVVQMTFMFGILIGNVLFGIWADRIGRKRPLFFAVILQAVTALAAALSPWFEVFVVLRFLLAICTGGTMITSFVMCMEIVGGWWRTTIPILYQIPFGLGQILMAGFAYFITDWRHREILISLLSAVFIACWWIIPESPRWLLAVGRGKTALKILENAVQKNGRPIELLRDLKIEENYQKEHQVKQEDEKQRIGIIELFRRPDLCRMTICIFLNWLVGGLTFFGISQYLAYIGGSVFLNVSVAAALGVPGTIACVYIVQHFGRKPTLIVTQAITGVAILLIIFFPNGVYVGDWPRITLAVIGSITMSITFPTIYLYSGELFPTVVRNSAMGIASMSARLGSMAAPFIATLGIYGDYLPPLIFGGVSIAGTVLVLLLPETIGKPLPDSIQDAETFFKKLTYPDKEKANYIHVLQDPEDSKITND